MCPACGQGGKPMTWDHKIALCFGGSNRPENIEAICIDCNQEKARWEAEQALDMGLRGPERDSYDYQAEEES